MKVGLPPKVIEAKRQSTSTSSNERRRICPTKSPFKAHAKCKTFAAKQKPVKLFIKAMYSRIAED